MTLPRTITAAALAAVLVVAPACSDDDSTTTGAGGDTSAVDTTSSTAVEELTVDDLWIRAMPAASGMTAGYLTITSPIDDELLEVRVDPSVAGVVELHETVAAGEDEHSDHTDHTDEPDGHGAMTMQEVESIPVPAGTPVTLEPGGLHMMFLEVPAQLEIGQEVELTFVFAQAGEITGSADVRES